MTDQPSARRHHARTAAHDDFPSDTEILDRATVLDSDSGYVGDEPRPRLEVSATKVTAGMVAGIASALLGSTLGLTGTVVGAALGAAAYTIAAAIYEHSVARTKRRVHRARQARLSRLQQTYGATMASAMATAGSAGAEKMIAASDVVRGETAGSPSAHETASRSQNSDTGSLASAENTVGEGDFVGVDTAADRTIAPPAARAHRSSAIRWGRGRGPDRGRRARNAPEHRRRGAWGSVLAGAVGSAFAFGLALVLVTGIESANGEPLSGGNPGGLSVLGGASIGQPDLVAPPAETTDVTRTHVSTSVRTEVSTETAVVTTTQTATTTPAAAPTTDAGTTSPDDDAPSETPSGAAPSDSGSSGAPTTGSATPGTDADSGSGSDSGSAPGSTSPRPGNPDTGGAGTAGSEALGTNSADSGDAPLQQP